MRMRVAGRSMRFIDGEISGKKTACEPVRDNWSAENPEPASDSEICRMSPEQYRSWRETGRKPVMDDDPHEFEPVADSSCKAAEAFALASDRKNGYDNGRPTSDAMAAMSPVERFAAASAARNRLNPNYAADARRRRR